MFYYYSKRSGSLLERSNDANGRETKLTPIRIFFETRKSAFFSLVVVVRIAIEMKIRN